MRQKLNVYKLRGQSADLKGFPYKPAVSKYSLTPCKVHKGFTVLILGTKKV